MSDEKRRVPFCSMRGYQRDRSTGQGTKMTWDLSQGVFIINSPTRNMERLETLWKGLPLAPSTKNLRWRQLQRRLGEGSTLGGIQAEAHVGVLRNESVCYSQRCDTWRPPCPNRPCSQACLPWLRLDENILRYSGW